jgi:uncharacterized RDD family membrane protein YckC
LNCVSTTEASDGEAAVGAWRGELGQRLQAYRARRGQSMSTPASAPAQSRLPFAETEPARHRSRAVGAASAAGVVVVPAIAPEPIAVPEPSRENLRDDEFSFTIAIGRYTAPPSERRDGRMEIDVSIPPALETDQSSNEEFGKVQHYGLYPVASLEDRRYAAIIDIVCLLFAYGGFVALFSSLGGQFTLSKLSAAVYGATFAVVYLQYFAQFTIFGGTTPGMMFRGLQVATFSGAPPAPRQYLLRSLGYVLSAAACFAGFAWAWWDEDGLTWHDRISRTYLSSPATRAAWHAPSAAHSR